MRHTRASRLVPVLLAALLATAAGAATFDQLTPGEGIDKIQFQHLAMNDGGQYVAVSNSQVYVGDANAGTFARVLTNERLGFVLESSASTTVENTNVRMDLAMLGTRLAINARGDYLVASHTMLFVGSAAGGEPRKVYEEANAMVQQVAINDQGHYVALTRRGILAGNTADATPRKLVSDAPGSFEAFSIDGMNGNWMAEVGQNRLALNGRGQFVAASGRAVYAGSVPDGSVTKVYEHAKVGFRQVKLSPDGTYIAVSARNVYRGKF